LPIRIYFTVTNDLSYDQRMQRICGSLAGAGYDITLVGRERPGSLPLQRETYRQHRIRCWNDKGKLFYAEYNFRLYHFLKREKMDGICAIDLDTILPCLRISRRKSIPRIYDAHELFTEMKEVRTRPLVRDTWMRIERTAVPAFILGYTVSEGLADVFRSRYNREYEVIRNLPVLEERAWPGNPQKFILYQGAVNEARKFEALVPAMRDVDARLVVCGDGNFMDRLKELIVAHGLDHKIELRGMLSPSLLKEVSAQARVGVGLAEKEGLNQYHALPNKFFDYIHAGLPQVTMNFPEYRKINDQFKVALLLDEARPDEIALALNNLLHDDVLYAELRANALLARQELNWQKEEQKLIRFYNQVFHR
jgi:glycosyltransferase involved in cell wall biosynthesis